MGNHFQFLSSACSFCIYTSLPMQFVQQHAQKSMNIVLGCEVVTRTTSPPVDFVHKLAYNWFLRFCADSGRVRYRSRFLLQVVKRTAVCYKQTGLFVLEKNHRSPDARPDHQRGSHGQSLPLVIRSQVRVYYKRDPQIWARIGSNPQQWLSNDIINFSTLLFAH